MQALNSELVEKSVRLQAGQQMSLREFVDPLMGWPGLHSKGSGTTSPTRTQRSHLNPHRHKIIALV